jgi:hypothetical protein
MTDTEPERPAPRIVVGYIEPIRAEDIRLPGGGSELAGEAVDLGAVSPGGAIRIPIAAPDGVHIPQLVSAVPLVVADVTIAHAREVAEQLIELSASPEFPHTAEAGDALAMAYTVLHFTAKEG